MCDLSLCVNRLVIEPKHKVTQTEGPTVLRTVVILVFVVVFVVVGECASIMKNLVFHVSVTNGVN